MQKNCLSILLSVIFALSIIGCSSGTTNSNQNISTETTKNEESSSNSEYTDYLKDDIGILFYDSVLFRKNIYPESVQHARILLSRQTNNGDDKEQKELHFTISISV